MLDKTLVNIIAMVFGFVGLIGAITKYEFPKARKTVYGENLYEQKEDIINNQITWFFTLYAGIGILFQILYNEVLGDMTPDRLYNNGFYLVALAFGIVIAAIIIPLIKTLSKWSSKRKWRALVVTKAKSNFFQAKATLEDDKRKNKEVAIKTLIWLEELLEVKVKNQDINLRLTVLGKYFSEK